MGTRCGCAAKLSAVELAEMLNTAASASPLAPMSFGAGPEDCAVLAPLSTSIVVTVDFGPLVVPSAFRSGAIAATHALSDVFSMGGTPVSALAVMVVDPALPAGAPSEVLTGMVSVCAAEGVDLAGGHTTVGEEAIAGLSVIGRVGQTVLKKRGARCGDVLLISKALGTGLALRAWRQGLLDLDSLQPVLALMETSNRRAGLAALHADAHAATDVTGFGLLGHLAEVLAVDGLGATLQLGSVPILDAARDLPPVLARSKWIEDNLAYTRRTTRLSGVTDRDEIAALLDPQTSGGMLVAVDAGAVGGLIDSGFKSIGVVTDRAEMEIQR